MSLLTVLRSGVAIADNVTKPLQSVITYQQETGADAYGAKTYGSATPLHAIVDYKAQMVRTKEGILTATRATVLLLDINEVIAATGGLGIGNNDLIVLQDGDSGPILDLSGFVDAGTGNPIATTIMLG